MAGAKLLKQDVDKYEENVFKKEYLDILEKDLICSRCKMVPRDPQISRCQQLHLMCLQCFQKHRTPLAGGVYQAQCAFGGQCAVYVREPVFSLFIENFLKWFLTKCQFTDNGCTVAMKQKQLQFHEIDCVYRTIHCPFLGCTHVNVTFIGYQEHLTQFHRNLAKIGKAKTEHEFLVPDVELPRDCLTYIPQELTFRNRHFYTEFCRDSASKSRFFWIYFHGNY
jgi:hypothetical protein